MSIDAALASPLSCGKNGLSAISYFTLRLYYTFFPAKGNRMVMIH